MTFVIRMAMREVRASWRRLVFFFVCRLYIPAQKSGKPELYVVTGVALFTLPMKLPGCVKF